MNQSHNALAAYKISDGTVRVDSATGKLNTSPAARAHTLVTDINNHIQELLGSGPATEGSHPT